VAYRFRPGEPAEREFSRIAAEEVDSAIELLSTSHAALDHRVHETRKHLKKLRGLLALVAGALDPKQLGREKEVIRGAAHAIPDLRGRAALVEAFEALLEHSPDGLGDDASARVREVLAGARAGKDSEPSGPARAEALLRGLRERLPKLHFRGDGWDALSPGFRATYTRARRAGERARKHPEAECLHRFRTPAKRHLYQIQLLEELYPELLHPHRRELSRLGDVLGEHHDVWLLRDELRDAQVSPDLATVEPLIRRRSTELEAAAFALEARLFAEKPGAITRRFARYFAATRL